MLGGRFAEAWRESERIAARGKPDPHRFWNGAPFAGRRVLIRCLHGFGDAIQFIRYGALVARTASHLTVQTHPELVSLFRCLSFPCDVVSWDAEPHLRWDVQIEVMELPRAFETTLETIPAEVPYFSVRESGRVAVASEKLRVGLHWGSSAYNPARSVPLAELLPVLESPGMEFYSFQRGEHRAELGHVRLPCPVRDISGESPDVIEAAADLVNIDLLITADTMIAHLAGALARPVWMLLPFEADWRWMLERRDSPWYPTMRLFRQRTPGNWKPAVRELAAELPDVVERTAAPARG